MFVGFATSGYLFFKEFITYFILGFFALLNGYPLFAFRSVHFLQTTVTTERRTPVSFHFFSSVPFILCTGARLTVPNFGAHCVS